MLKKSFGRWLENRLKASQHRAMQQLPDHLLRDIGITREDLRRALRSPDCAA